MPLFVAKLQVVGNQQRIDFQEYDVIKQVGKNMAKGDTPIIIYRGGVTFYILDNRCYHTT